MAFAYVKLLEGPKRGRKIKVCTTQVQPSVQNLNYSSSKKYIVNMEGSKYHCCVLFAAEASKELDSKIIAAVQTRMRTVPVGLMQSATESESDASKENKLVQSKSLKIPDVKKAAHKAQRLGKFSSLLNMDVKKLQDMISNNDNKEQSNTQNLSNIDSVKLDKKKDHSSIVAKSDKQMTIGTGQNSIAIPCITHPDAENAAEVENKAEHPSASSNNQRASKRSISDAGESDEKLSKKLKTEMKEKDREMSKLRKKIGSLKSELKEAADKIKRTESLNVQLQKHVIDKFMEQTQVEKQLKGEESKKDIDPAKNFVSVGFRRSADDTIHIGRNFWVPRALYDNIVSSSSTPLQFAGNVATAIFGESVLMKSTVTGRASNRSKADGKIENPEKLDPTKREACKEFFKHWLNGPYKDSLSQKKKESEDLDKHYGLFLNYVGKKISYLKTHKNLPKCTKSKKNPKTVENNDVVTNDTPPPDDQNSVLIYVPTKEHDHINEDENMIQQNKDFDADMTDVSSVISEEENREIEKFGDEIEPKSTELEEKSGAVQKNVVGNKNTDLDNQDSVENSDENHALGVSEIEHNNMLADDANMIETINVDENMTDVSSVISESEHEQLEEFDPLEQDNP